MSTTTSGVYPVYENQFKIGTSGKTSEASAMVSIADLETFQVSMDNGIEEWTPMETEGWVKRFMTAKGLTISLTGKRSVGDAGNDYVSGLFFANGSATETKFEWTFPTGTKVAFDCIVNVTSAGGDSTNVEPLEFEVMSSGKPTVTPAA